MANTCKSIWNKYFWGNSLVSNRLKESDIITPMTLLIIRIIFLLFGIEMLLWSAIYYRGRSSNPLEALMFFTIWGAIGTAITFLLLILQHYPENHKKICLWKFTHFLFELWFSMQLMIAVVFYAMILPYLDEYERDEFKDVEITWQDYVINIQLHGLLFIFLCVDNIFNRVKFIMSHLLFIMGILIIYFIVLVFVSIYDEEVYPKVTFKNWHTLGFCSLAIFFAIFGFIGGYYWSRAKKRKYTWADAREQGTEKENNGADGDKEVIDLEISDNIEEN